MIGHKKNRRIVNNYFEIPLKNEWFWSIFAFSSADIRMYLRKDFSVLWPVIFIIEIVGTPARNILVAKVLRAV